MYTVFVDAGCCMVTVVKMRSFYYYSNIPCVQLLPVQLGEHVHIPGKVQFPPLKQPAGHIA